VDRRRRVYHHLVFGAGAGPDLAYALICEKQRRQPWVYQDVYRVAEDSVRIHHIVVSVVQRIDARSWEELRLDFAEIARVSGGEYTGSEDRWPYRRRRRR
jgi:hypothetical protein